MAAPPFTSLSLERAFLCISRKSKVPENIKRTEDSHIIRIKNMLSVSNVKIAPNIIDNIVDIMFKNIASFSPFIK